MLASASTQQDGTGKKAHLERVDVAKTILHVAVDDELRQTQDLTAQVKRVAEPRLLSLLHQSASHIHFHW